MVVITIAFCEAPRAINPPHSVTPIGGASRVLIVGELTERDVFARL